MTIRSGFGLFNTASEVTVVLRHLFKAPRVHNQTNDVRAPVRSQPRSTRQAPNPATKQEGWR